MAQALEVIDTTVQKTNLWLKEVMEEAGWDDRHKAYLALRAVLHALRDRLTPEEAAHLSAQLPMLIRGLFFEGWRPADVPRRIRNKREFFALAASYFPDTGDPADPEVMTRAVLRTLARNVTTGEMKDVAGLLPEGLAEMLAAPAPGVGGT